MRKVRYLDNAFWEDNEKTQLKCIRMTTLDSGDERKDILSVSKFNKDGSENQEFKEIVNFLSLEAIDRSHKERVERKAKEAEEERIVEEQKADGKRLEKLFGLKLKAFELESVKNTENRKLRTRLRRAQNEIEVNAIVALIIGEEMGLLGND